jgi:hypothetical protein
MMIQFVEFEQANKCTAINPRCVEFVRDFESGPIVVQLNSGERVNLDRNVYSYDDVVTMLTQGDK